MPDLHVVPTPPTRWLDDEQQGSWRALVIGMTLLTDQLSDDLEKRWGISLTEYEILVRLSECPDRQMRMARLAAALAHSRSRVTHTVRRMQDRGWVTRSASPDDGRGVLCQMTDEGHALLTDAAHTHVQGVREYLVDLVDAGDFAAVGRVMNAVSDRLISRAPEMEIRQPR